MKFHRIKNKGIIFICIIILLFVNFGCSLYEKYENDISKGEAPIKKSLDDIDPKYHIHEKERINFILEMDDLLKAKEIDNFVPNVPIDQEYLLNLDSRSGPCPYCYEWPTVTVCAAAARFDGSKHTLVVW